MHSEPFTNDSLKYFEKLKDDFALHLQYSDYKELESITSKMFGFLREYRDAYPNHVELVTTIGLIEFNYKEGKINEFISSINMVTDIILTKNLPNVKIEKKQFIEKSPLLSNEISDWVEEEKESQGENKEQIVRIKRKVSEIYQRVNDED